jgi:hypothetical protein
MTFLKKFILQLGIKNLMPEASMQHSKSQLKVEGLSSLGSSMSFSVA